MDMGPIGQQVEDPASRIPPAVYYIETPEGRHHAGALYDLGRPTRRLLGLRNGERLTKEDVLGLFAVFEESEAYVGVMPTMADFAIWLAGAPRTKVYDAIPPASITW